MIHESSYEWNKVSLPLSSSLTDHHGLGYGPDTGITRLKWI